jgi:hypothetical protein
MTVQRRESATVRKVSSKDPISGKDRTAKERGRQDERKREERPFSMMRSRVSALYMALPDGA